MKRLGLAAATALVVVVAACSPTVDELTPATPTSLVVETPPTTGTVRPLRTVSCESATEDSALLCEAYDLIRRHYVDTPSDAQLAEAATQGLLELDGASSQAELTCALPAEPFEEVCLSMAAQAEDAFEGTEAALRGIATFALDANSVYLDPEALALVEEEQQGQIQGIGALVSAEDTTLPVGEQQCSVISATCSLVIVSTIAGSPADAAGLLRDDVIVGVNGESIDGWSVDEVTAAVRGASGTEVTLTMIRGVRRFDVVITRAEITIPVVETEIVGRTGYIRLNIFTDNADEQFESGVKNLVVQGIDELVVDLRDNPGGILDSAVLIASEFLATGDVVITQSPESNVPYHVAGDPDVPQDIAVTLLVNKGSASASEVLAAVLQETGRATVVGENTFGKNTVQQRFHLSNGGALKLTVARWVTPGGLDFGGVGVTPDVYRSIEPDLSVEALVELATAAT